MNKLFKCLSTAVLGIAMAVGVGVGVASGVKASEVKAEEKNVELCVSFNRTIAYGDSDTFTVSAPNLDSGNTTLTIGYNGVYRQSKTNTYFQMNKKSGYFRNDTKLPGKITKIVTTWNNDKNPKKCYFGAGSTASNQNEGTYSSGTFTPPSDNNYFFFNIDVSAGSGSSQMTSCKVYYDEAGSGKKVSSLSVNPDDPSETTLDAMGDESVVENISYCVNYEGGDTGYDIKVECPESVLITDDHEGNLSLTFTRNNEENYFDIKIASSEDETKNTTLRYKVKGIVILCYEKVTNLNLLKAGTRLVIVSEKNSKGLSTTQNGNNRGQTDITIESGKIIKSDYPNLQEITLEGESGAWKLNVDGKYLYAAAGGNYLRTSEDESADSWSIYKNNDVTMIESSTKEDYAIKHNSSASCFSCYSSGQGDVEIYAIPSTDPAISLSLTEGTSNLAVNDKATLKAELINVEEPGNVTFSIVDNTPSSGSGNVISLGTPSENSVDVTGLHDGTAKVKASYQGCDDAFMEFTVTKALSSLAVKTNPTKTTYKEGQTFDPTGLVLTATYDDESTKEVTKDTTGFDYVPKGTLSTADTAVTLKYTENEVTVTTSLNITVEGRQIQNISVDNMPTKVEYFKGETLDTTGLVVMAHYDAGDDANVTSDCSFSPIVLNTVGEQIAIDVCYGTGEGAKHTSFNVKVNDISGLIDDGRYFIVSSVNDTVLSGIESSDSSPVQTEKYNGVAFDFKIVANNTYSISTTIIKDDSPVKCSLINNSAATSSSNTSIRVRENPTAELKSTDWIITHSTAIGKTDFYNIKQNTTGTTYRYLSAFGTSDWRGYLNTNNGDPNLKLVEEKTMFADNMLGYFTAGCKENGYETEDMHWSAAKTQFESLSAENKAILKSGDTTDSNILAALARYDQVVSKYPTVFEDFIGRGPASISGSSIMTVFGDTNNSIIMVTVVAITSLTALGGYFYIRRRKETH